MSGLPSFILVIGFHFKSPCRGTFTATSIALRFATCSGDNTVLINLALIENSEPYTSGCCLEIESQGACLADLSHH